MITIQGFAKLCNCKAQTLRYYDKIDLLKPAKVDEWTGYRYYEEKQALLYVKIKNLQQADFSIDEIRELLDQSDDVLMEAFNKKIAEQESKLAQIKKIQASYLEETMTMERLVNAISGMIEEQTGNPEIWKECGIDPEKDTEYVAKANALLADWLSQCKELGEDVFMQMDDRLIPGARKVTKELESGNWKEAQKLMLTRESRKDEKMPKNVEVLFERHGWEHVADFMKEMPEIEEGREYFFVFEVQEDSPVCAPGFTMTFLVLVASKLEVFRGGVTCNIHLSSDGQNHFKMLRER